MNEEYATPCEYCRRDDERMIEDYVCGECSRELIREMKASEQPEHVAADGCTSLRHIP
jgi:DNA-directed RNA polymerase subunit RPC12/RpoP